MIREFRLSSPGSRRGVSCDETGAFVGAIPLLERFVAHGKENWQPRDRDRLSKQLASHFALPVDISSKAGGLTVIANALNEGDVALAQIATVLLGIPDSPMPSNGTFSRDGMIKLIRDLHMSGMIAWDDSSGSPSKSVVEPESSKLTKSKGVLTKADFNPDEPRDNHGQWTDADGGIATPNTNRRSMRIQLADAGISDAVDDPVAEAAARAASQRSTGSPRPSVKPSEKEYEDTRQSLSSRFLHEAETVISEIGHAEIIESNANLAAATGGANAVANGLRDYVNYRARPWIGSDGLSVQVPIINTGDPNSDQGALIAHTLLEPNGPLTRPGTNADWIDPLTELISAGAAIASPALRAIRVGTIAAAESSTVAIDTPFIILPSELPEGFDIRLPIGKYVIPTEAAPTTTTYGNLVHMQIGDLVQRTSPNVAMILRTSPGMKGVDIEIPFDHATDFGFQFGEIKPLTDSGYRIFNSQVARWKLPAPVHAFTYDYRGNIYYGFPW